MILEKTPITFADVQERVKSLEEKQELKEYLKKFTKLKKDKADALMSDLRDLKNVKISDTHAVKVADFLPIEPEEVNKLFIDVTLSEEEVNKIIEVVKKYAK